jgi:predicted CoA-binding protein
MITQAQIDTFFAEKTIALAGVSRNPKKFGNVAFKTLLDKKKYVLLPINPNCDKIDEVTCFKSIQNLPAGINAIVLMTKKTQTNEMLHQTMDKGIKNIWIQQGTDTPEARQLASTEGYNIIYGKCIMMFAEPEGFHKFHRSIMKFFGRLPK